MVIALILLFRGFVKSAALGLCAQTVPVDIRLVTRNSECLGTRDAPHVQRHPCPGRSYSQLSRSLIIQIVLEATLRTGCIYSVPGPSHSDNTSSVCCPNNGEQRTGT